LKSGVTTASYGALIAWAGQFDMLEAAAAGLSHLDGNARLSDAAIALP
jgi:hypothetical protein